jgi:pimeloyl-ACP methyl ester carboxylesterase
MNTTTISTALVAAFLAVVLAACGGASTDQATDVTIPTSSTSASPTSTTVDAERPSTSIDQLVTIDRGALHIRCTGQGTTTVVLVAGWGGGIDSWATIQPTIAEHTRVCSYSRFGTGTSDPPSTPQTFRTEASDLHDLLDAAGEPGPYIVVGHSFGGAESVAFASQYHDEVDGLMLLDASPTTWPAAVCAVPNDGTEMAASFQGLCAVMHDPTLDPERLDAVGAFGEVATISSLDDLPMTVVTAAHRSFPGLAQPELARLDRVWNAGVEHWAALSTSSRIVTVEDTSHDIQLDQPRLVTDELLALLP